MRHILISTTGLCRKIHNLQNIKYKFLLDILDRRYLFLTEFYHMVQLFQWISINFTIIIFKYEDLADKTEVIILCMYEYV